jgi:drug/metabolite transporter (DMT)-like permease
MKLLIVWLAVCLIWSTVWLFIKLGLNDIPPFSFAGIRLIIALSVLLPVMFVQRKPLPRKRRDFVLIALTGLLLLGLNYGLLYWGTQHISSGLTAVLQSATPIFGLVLAHYLIPGERITLLKLFGLGLGIAGVAVIFFNQLQLAGWTAFLGCVAVVVGAICVAISYVLVKAYGTHLHPTTLITGQMLCGLIPLVTLGFITEGNPLTFHWTLTAVVSLLYLALAGSIAAFWLNYWLLARMDATKVMLMGIAETLIAVLLGAVILGETITVRTLIGGACILLSVWLVMIHQPVKNQAASE